MTDAEFRAWLLRDGAKRTVLCQLDYQFESTGVADTGTLYLSNRPYVDNVTPRAYDECIKSVPSYSRSLIGAQLNSYQVSFGVLEIADPDGAHDFLLPLASDGSEARFYFGDESWPVADFRLIFTCMVQKIVASDLDRKTIHLKDASLLINKSIGGEVKVGGDGPNADRWRPVPFGYIHQGPCLAWDDPTLSYVFADSGTGIIDDAAVFEPVVRDRGVPVDFTNNDDGTLSLLAAPDGEITIELLCTPDGTASHRCTSDAVEYFIGERAGLNALTKYDGPGPTYDERPATGVQAFWEAGGEDYPLGALLFDSRNAIDLLNEITDSGLCFWACTRAGALTLGRLRPNDIAGLGVTPSRAIVEDDIDDGTFRVDHALPTYYKLQAEMSRNWTKIGDFADVLTPEERAYLTRDGLAKIQDHFTSGTYTDNPEQYHLSMARSPLIRTLLSGGGDAFDLDELERWMGVRRGYTLPWVETVSLRTGLDRYELELGDVVPIDFTHTGRIMFDPARNTQVIGIDINLTTAKIDLRLLHRRNAEAPSTGGTSTPEDEPPLPPLPPIDARLDSIDLMACVFPRLVNVFTLLDVNCLGGVGEGDWVVHDGTGELVALTMVYGRDITYNAVYWSDLVAYDADAGLQGYLVSFGNSVTPPADPATDLYWLYTVTAPGYSVPADVYVGDIANRAGVMTVWEPLTDLPGLVNGGSYVFYLWWGLDPSGLLLNGDTAADPPWGAPPAVRPFSHSLITLQCYLTADNSTFGPPIVFTEYSA